MGKIIIKQTHSRAQRFVRNSPHLFAYKYSQIYCKSLSNVFLFNIQVFYYFYLNQITSFYGRLCNQLFNSR